MKKNILNFTITACLFVLFAIYTIIVKFVDIDFVVQTKTNIGLSTINKYVFKSITPNETWGTISTIILVLACLVVVILATLATLEFIKTKKLSKVNRKILFMLGLYILTVLFYVLFELVIVNYRPLLDEGVAKASYPSSHTLLVCVVCWSACFAVSDYIKNKPAKIAIIAALILISIIAPITRLLAGVHWLTDVIGSLLLAAALVMCYYSALCLIKKSNTEKTPN